MRDVKCVFPAPYLIDKDQHPLNQLRSIITDENNQLIANEETYFLYKKYHKKTIPVWKLSLLDLENGKYNLNDLTKAFDLMERTDIGIVIAKHLGERRGRNNVGNFPHLKGTKTRDLIAKCLALGDEKNFRYLKRIRQYGCVELIRQVRHEKIAVSRAAKFVELSYSQ
jgi:hypothetical protein